MSVSLKSVSFVVLSVFIFSSTVHARHGRGHGHGLGHGNRDGVHGARRIHRGEKSGQLTEKESSQLKEQRKDYLSDRAKFRDDKKAAAADGISKDERLKIREDRKALKSEQKEYSKDIYKLKHNDEKVE